MKGYPMHFDHVAIGIHYGMKLVAPPERNHITIPQIPMEKFTVKDWQRFPRKKKKKIKKMMLELNKIIDKCGI